MNSKKELLLVRAETMVGGVVCMHRHKMYREYTGVLLKRVILSHSSRVSSPMSGKAGRFFIVGQQKEHSAYLNGT